MNPYLKTLVIFEKSSRLMLQTIHLQIIYEYPFNSVQTKD